MNSETINAVGAVRASAAMDRSTSEDIDHEAAERFVPDHVRAKLHSARRRAWLRRVYAARKVLEEALRSDPSSPNVPDDVALNRAAAAVLASLGDGPFCAPADHLAHEATIRMERRRVEAQQKRRSGGASLSAAGLTARLAEAARGTGQSRLAPESPSTMVARKCPDGFFMCVKPWATDAWGAVSEVCSSKPAHHKGLCGPWMPEVGEWRTPAPRDAEGRVVNLDELDYGCFEDPS